MEQAYAQALWKMLANGADHKKAIHALHEQLKAHGRAALMPRIARAFARIADRELAKSTLVLTVAREKDAHKAEKEAKGVLEQLRLDASGLKKQVDDSLIGGWRLEGGGVLVDASYKKHLLDMYNKATAA